MKVPSFFKSFGFRYSLAGFACSVIAYGAWTFGTPVYHEFSTSFAMKEFKQYGVWGTYHKHFFSFADRFKGLVGLEEENEALTEKVAQLEKENVVLQSEHTERELASVTKTTEESVKEKTGSETAVVLDSIEYKVPAHVSGAGLHALALGYFRKQEYAKSVVLFDHLVNLKEDPQFKTAENYLMAGIAWYHLKNYKEAHNQVDQALKASSTTHSVHRSALMWDAMITKAEGNPKETQAKLLKFIELYPHSEEAKWINTRRSPAGGKTHE